MTDAQPPQQYAGYPPPAQGYNPQQPTVPPPAGFVVQQPGQGYPAQQPGQGYAPQQAYNMQPVPPGPPGAAAAQWMTKPQVPGCPPGLEYLTQVDQLLVQQSVELLEALTNFETQNKYVVKNTTGQQVYHAAEESGFCMRQCCGPRRGFTIHIADNFGSEVMRIQRDFKCCAGCCWFACVDCCAHEIVVEAPVGTPVGYIRQSCSFFKPRFEVFDSEHESVMTIAGPWCICECPCCDIDFNLYTRDGDEVGKVNKQWSGLVKEMFVDADNFGITFPMNLDVKVKATLLGAVFLIDYMYFEKTGNKNDNH